MFTSLRPDIHLSIIRRLAFAVRALVFLLILLATYLPLFDDSPDLLLQDSSTSRRRWLSGYLRWDAFHFAHIAQKGYAYEHEFAFPPGTPGMMRIGAEFLRFLHVSAWDDYPDTGTVLVGGAILAFLFDSTQDLYRLTLYFTKSPQVALLTAFLALLPSSPATLLYASYTEPFFAFFSYKGMLFCTQRRWFSASICFALATTFRANGILLCGYLLWGLIAQPLLLNHRIYFQHTLLALILSIVTVTPFILHQSYAYVSFCQAGDIEPREWCHWQIPAIYTFVQDKYWNVGFLRYWTLSQIPNFALATPILALLLYSSLTHIYTISPYLVSSLFSKPFPPPHPSNPFRTLDTFPYALHTLILTFILLFASHTQIALRLASSLPYTYWAATSLFWEHPKAARAWATWSVVWGAVSVVLWGTFLPPA